VTARAGRDSGLLEFLEHGIAVGFPAPQNHRIGRTFSPARRIPTTAVALPGRLAGPWIRRGIGFGGAAVIESASFSSSLPFHREPRGQANAGHCLPGPPESLHFLLPSPDRNTYGSHGMALARARMARE
jgi:hypothetical protein